MVMKEKEREEDRALSNALRYSPYKVLLNTLECIMTPDDFGEWQSGQNTKVFVDEEDAVGREMKDLLVAEIVKQNKVSCPLCCTCEREQCSMVVHSWSLPFQNQTKMSGPSVYILALTVCLQQTGIENDARCQAWILDKSKGQQIYRPCKGKGGGRAYCPSHLGVGPWKPTVRQALVFMEEGKPGFDNDPRYVRKLAEESPLDYIAKVGHHHIRWAGTTCCTVAEGFGAAQHGGGAAETAAWRVGESRANLAPKQGLMDPTATDPSQKGGGPEAGQRAGGRAGGVGGKAERAMEGGESVPRPHGCGPRSVYRQTCSKAIQTSKIVTTGNVLLLGEVRRAVYGLASHSYLPGRADEWGN
eukprot:1148008-Pelagomonas_calceolata.AAC.5